MDGREKCRLLRQLRDDNARRNGIEISREACTYEGECSGACPKCDAELEALTKELEKRGVRVPGESVVIEPDESFGLMGKPVNLDNPLDLEGDQWL